MNQLTVRFFAVLLIAFAAVAICGCSEQADYSKSAAYEALFEADDSAAQKELKSFIIRQIERYNREDAEAYASGFDWEPKDRDAFVAQFQKTAKTVKAELTIGTLRAVVLDSNPDQAQGGALIRTVLTDKSSGEELDDHYNRVTYTMSRREGTWYITEAETGADQYSVSSDTAE